jgi:hypothetical protein
MFNISYAIRTTPLAPEILDWILEAQAIINEVVSWSNDDCLTLARVDGTAVRDTQVFPFTYTAQTPIDIDVCQKYFETYPKEDIPKATAVGHISVNTLWEFQLIVAFLRIVSERFPELAISLSDDTRLLCPVGMVRLESGKFTPYTDWLRAEHEFYLEMSSDVEGVGEAMCAVDKALEDGTCFTDMPAARGAYERIKEQGLDVTQYQDLSVGEVAERFVRQTLSDVISRVA